MNKSKAKLRHENMKRLRRPMIIGLVLAFATVAIGAAAIAARRPSEQAAAEPGRNAPRQSQTLSALAAPQDPQTAQIRPLTQDEAQRLATALKELANQSTEGLKPVQHADGSVSIDLDGRFQNVVLGRRNLDGSIAQGCVDNSQAGAAFFGIDPQLVGADARPANGPGKTPAPIQ